MIKNERQLKITERKHRDLVASIEADREQLAAMPADKAELLRSSVDRLIAQLADEICEYRELQERPAEAIVYRNLTELPRALIRARIALGLTQAQLADLLEIHENQIQKYEATDYEKASLARLQEIEDVLAELIAAS